MQYCVLLLSCVVIFASLNDCTAQNYTSYQAFQNNGQNLQVGQRPFADKLFHREIIRVKHQIFSRIKERRTFSTDGKAKITMINAYSQKQNGATATLVNGGPGQIFATLEFLSQPGHGIDFVVELYARYY